MAEEKLETVRVMMERTTLYRRTLAPIMIYLGTIAIISAVVAEVGLFNGYKSIRAPESIALFWLCVGGVALLGALVLARHKAIGTSEPFWSTPTCIVVQSIAPLLLVGFALGLVEVLWPLDADNPLLASASQHGAIRLISLWLMFYGCALILVGSLVRCGLKLFGWFFLVVGVALYFLVNVSAVVKELPGSPDRYASLLMGLFFGCGHLACGVYLYFTEDEDKKIVEDEEPLKKLEEAEV